MKNPFRRRWPAAVPAPVAEQEAADALREALKNAKPGEALVGDARSMQFLEPARPALDPDVQAAISAALEKHPAPVAAGGRFFGVPLSYFNRDELMQIISWVADNARDHRRDL